MDIRLLGPVELVADDGHSIPLAGNKIRGLLAVLALDVGHAVTPQRLIDALWGEQEVSGPNVVQVLVSKLRRSLAEAGESNVIATLPAGYSLDVATEATDVARFEALVESARASDAEHAAALLEQALGLWRGAALGGIPDTERTAAMRARLDEMRRAAVDDLTDAQLQLGRHHRVVAELEALVADDPLRERRWAQLMRALYASGRQADAMRAFQRAREVLIEAVGAEPGPELRRLESAVLAHDDAVLGAPAAATAGRPVGDGFRRRGNLRHPVDRCIGRELALADLHRIADGHRLITLTGPGGVGKTRLAQEFGVSHADRFSDGVWWIELAPARSDSDVAGAIQRALGIDGGPVTDATAAIEAVVTIMGERQALIIVDNCEHLVDELRWAVNELLGRCPGITVIATSRQALDIGAERLFDVVPLEPEAAVALFQARIVGNDADHDPNSIREIVDRLDRLPLALELAAARTRYFQIDEIRSRLSNRFDLLGETSRSAQAHQRNLRAVADWSYDLLDGDERRVFERLSVFADGAPLSGAVAVCAGESVAATDVERVLHRLVDKSLVVADRSASGTRYRMLQTLADYATERLQQQPDGERATRLAHAEWVRDLAATVAFGQPTDGPTIAAVHDEDAAVRDAVTWALDNDPALALEICEKLAGFWFGTMRVSSGWELLSAALDADPGNDERLRAAGQGWAALFATMLQDLDTARVHVSAALDTEHRLDEPARLGRLTLLIALAAGYRDDPVWRDWIDQSRTYFAKAGVERPSGHASFAEGAVMLLRGDATDAADRLRAAVAEFRDSRDHLGQILAVSRLGELAWRLGDIDLFAEMHAELYELGVAGRSSGVITGATARLAHARLAQGDLAEADRLARLALAGSGSSFMPVINGYVFRTAGLVNVALGHVDEGRKHLETAIEAFCQGTGTLGIGQAALCWIDISASQLAAGEWDAAVATAELAIDAAGRSGEPWVIEQARLHRQRLADAAGSLPLQDA